MARIKALSKAAQTIFNHFLTLTNENGYAKIDNSNGSFMAVTVEKIDENAIGPVYSVAHYYEQNGDLMRDPEITYQVDTNGVHVTAGYAFPTSTTQDGVPASFGGGYREYITYNDDCTRVRSFSPYHQNDAATFSTMWFRNIKQQQGLRPKPMPKTQHEIEMAAIRKRNRQILKELEAAQA